MKPFILAFSLLVSWVVITNLLCWLTTGRLIERKAGLSESLDNLQKAGLRLTICTVSIVLAFTLLPGIFKFDPTAPQKWIHHVGVVLLGTFLAAALYFQLEIRMKFKLGFSLTSVRQSYQHWRELTELLPAPAAIMILVSGMGLVYTRAGYSIGRGWIFTLIVALAVMMADGIFGYSHDIRRLLLTVDLAVNQNWTPAEFVRVTRNRARDIRLLVHSLSFPIVLVFPASRICDARSPASPLLRRAGINDVPGWPQLWPALALFLIPFLTVAVLNRIGRIKPGDGIGDQELI